MFDETAFRAFKLPRYEQVRWQMQNQLVQQKWKIDEPIPTEQELAAQYQVSVGTIRKAVERLVEEGILVKIQGKGTFLKQPNFATSLMRFFRLRDQSGQYVQPVGMVKSIALVDPVPAINRQLNLSSKEALIHIERIRLIDNTVVLSEKIWLPKTAFLPLMSVAIADFGNMLYPFYHEKCGQFVSSATEQLSFVEQCDDKYLGELKDTPLVKICRIARNIEGDAIEYRESYGLARNFNYEVNIN